MRGKTSDKGSQQNRTHTIWIVMTSIFFMFSIGITTLLGQVTEPPGSAKTNLSDKKQQDDTTTKAEPQLEEPITNAKFQKLINEWSKEYLDLRIKSVDWWLIVITIILGLLVIIITILSLVGLSEFRQLRDEAKQHVEATKEDRNTVSAEFQELKNEAEQVVEKIRGQGNIVATDYQKLKRDAEHYIGEMRVHLETVRKTREEFDQEAIRQKATERLNALVFDTLSGNEEFEEVLRDFRQIPDLSPLEESVLDAYTLQQNHEIEEAIKKWCSIANITEGKNNNMAAHAWKSAGYLYRAEDRREEALFAFDNAIRLKREDGSIYVLRGNAKALLENYESAIIDYHEAIRWGANLEEMHSSCADARNALGRYTEAIVDCAEAIRLNPNYTEAYILRGEAKVGLQDLRGAITDFREALRLATNQGQEDLIDRMEERLQELENL